MKNDVVYVVDDSPLFCLSHQKLIEKVNSFATVKKFSRTDHALVNLRKDMRKNLNVLLLLDIEMPKMSGLDMLRYISKSKFLKKDNLEVVFVSSAIKGHLNDTIMKSLLVKGMIEKPLTLEKLGFLTESPLNKKWLEVVA